MWAPTQFSNGKLGDFTAGWQRWGQTPMIVGHAGWSGVEYVRTIDGQCSVIVFTDCPEAYVRALTMGILRLFAGWLFPQHRDVPSPEFRDNRSVARQGL